MQRDKSDIAGMAKEMRETSTKSKKWEGGTYVFLLPRINNFSNSKLTPEQLSIVQLERKTAQLPIRIGAHRSTITPDLTTVNNNMQLLQNSTDRTAKEMHKNFKQSVDDVQADASKFITDKEEFEQRVDSFVKEKTQQVSQIKEAMDQGKPLSLIQGMIGQTEKKEQQLEDKFTDITNQERKVQQQLGTLKRETGNIVLATGTAVRLGTESTQKEPSSRSGLGST